MNITQIKVKARVAGALVAATATVGLGIVTSAPVAHADPVAATSYIGVGSDTTQDVMNALAGSPEGTPLVFRAPVHSSSRSGSKTLTSWDAVAPGTTVAGCIIPGYGKFGIPRPNGSGSGLKALSRAIDGGAWDDGKGACGTQVAGNVTGAIDFARSSAPPNAAGTDLTWIPFGRDGVGYAYYNHNGGSAGDAAALSLADLQTLYGSGNTPSATGTLTLANGHTVFACMMQSGSGTGKFWDKNIVGHTAGDGTVAQQSAVNSGCNAVGQTVIEENGADSFFSSSFVQSIVADPTKDAVIPFSAGSWISQANKVANDRGVTGRGTGGVDMGNAAGLGIAYTGTAPTEAPNPTFYNDPTFGRNLWNVIAASRVAEAGLSTLFVGVTSAVCSQSALIASFGFSAPVGLACGDTSTVTVKS